MQISARFKLYRLACIANLVLMGLILLLVAWLIFLSGTRFNFTSLSFISIGLFIISYKNDTTGLRLFSKLAAGKTVSKEERKYIRFFWVLQIILQLIMGFQLVQTFIRYTRMVQISLPFQQRLSGFTLGSDIFGLLFFVTAVIGIINLWPFVTFIRKNHIRLHRVKYSGDGALLTQFENP